MPSKTSFKALPIKDSSINNKTKWLSSHSLHWKQCKFKFISLKGRKTFVSILNEWINGSKINERINDWINVCEINDYKINDYKINAQKKTNIFCQCFYHLIVDWFSKIASLFILLFWSKTECILISCNKFADGKQNGKQNQRNEWRRRSRQWWFRRNHGSFGGWKRRSTNNCFSKKYVCILVSFK